MTKISVVLSVSAGVLVGLCASAHADHWRVCNKTLEELFVAVGYHDKENQSISAGLGHGSLLPLYQRADLRQDGQYQRLPVCGEPGRRREVHVGRPSALRIEPGTFRLPERAGQPL